MLLWEIFTLGDQPYPGMDHIQAAELIAGGYTMESPNTCPQAM